MCGQIDPADLEALTHRKAVSLATEHLSGAVCGGVLCLGLLPVSWPALGSARVGGLGPSMELGLPQGSCPHPGG